MNNLKVSNILEGNSTWISGPGVVFGCGVDLHDRVWVDVLPGKISFPGARAAEIKHRVRNAVKIPSESGIYYIIATVSEAGVTFNPVKTTDDRHIAVPDAAPIAKVIVSNGTIKVFQHIGTNEERLLRNIIPTPMADGIQSRFYLPENIHSIQAVNLTVNGVPQVEGEDYVVRVETAPDGSQMSLVDFISEVPPAGSTIFADIYLGKTGVTQ